MAKEKITYVCENCGAQHAKLVGRCKHCKEFGTIIELKEINFDVKNNKNALSSFSWTGEQSQAVSLRNVKPIESKERIKTGLNELDRVLGGGIMPSSAILLSGEPGAGKSTILMQVCSNVGQIGKTVLYVSAEETAGQLKDRSLRLGVNFDLVEDNIIVLSENQLEIILEAIASIKPDLVIIDSIQSIFSLNINSTAGGVAQIQACALGLNKQCKQLGYGLLIVGHVTKDGATAGPKVFEHIVDVTLKFEVEGSTNFRSITSEKNRFGATETGFFDMNENGLESVDNPSNIFLPSEEYENHKNSIYVMRKGNRNILIEIQSLIEDQIYNSPKRIVQGLDLNRLHIILALLNSKLKANFSNQDVYSSVLNGISAKNPEADLPLLISIISNLRPFLDHIVSFGEISLNGSIRGVKNAESRIKDSINFGFKNFIIPLANKTEDMEKIRKSNPNINISYIKNIEDIMSVLTKSFQDEIKDL